MPCQNSTFPFLMPPNLYSFVQLRSSIGADSHPFNKSTACIVLGAEETEVQSAVCAFRWGNREVNSQLYCRVTSTAVALQVVALRIEPNLSFEGPAVIKAKMKQKGKLEAQT